MSDETPGAGQNVLPPRDSQGLRTLAERPPSFGGTTVRLAQVVGGQFVITSQPHGMPSIAQLTPGSIPGSPTHPQQGVTRIISISPSRVGQTSPLRPSLANQSIVNVLTSKSRTNQNVRLQLFPSGDSPTQNITHTPHSRPLKRPLSSSTDKKDAYTAKLQRVTNHRIVRSKLVKEKYNEHLLEAFYLETGNNILDLYQFAKKPKTQAYLAFLKEHAIDPRDYQDESPTIMVPQTTPSTPTATSASSLPGINHISSVSTSTPSVSAGDPNASTPKSSSIKVKSSVTSNQELIVEKAKQEAYVVQRIADLQKEGLWSEKRLPKVQDLSRAKAHWDFLLEEMVWLAADFAQERKWKKAAAKKCARMVQKYFQDKALAVQRAEKAQEQNLRRIAAFCAKEIKNFWNNVEKLVEYKQNTILEEKRKRALDQQLSFIVDQTEKYSQLLAEGMNKTVTEQAASNMSSRSVSRAQSDTEFDPDMQSDEDDEETIAQEEAALGTEGHTEEVEALQKESQMELDDLLEDDFLRNYLLNRDKIRLSESEDSDDEKDEKDGNTQEEGDDTKSERKSEVQDNEDKDEGDIKSEDSDSTKDDEEELSEDESSDEVKSSDQGSQGEHDELKLLVEDSHKEGEMTKTDTDKKDDLINDAAAIAESIQPKGNTLSSTNVSTNIPFLLKYSLREYQHIGLDWLVTMYERKLNGILADEMGLGKTIQTIALLAHLACEKENWGPHLIVVPTSVMLNWEMECKKWCPAFKILTYYGTQKERKMKRTGWTKPNAFHICITSYKLVIQDHQSFRRKKWKYLILDEAQNIKNFKSQRWQLLLNFQTQQRLLLTGTPLQNNLMELWSLMHFLMPNVFQSHREFKEWFSNPVTGMIEGNSEYNENIIKRLHKVLRPFLLRRLKSEVEKQMPKKYEHVVMCRLSKRQRFLYDDYMSRAKTKETLASGNLLSVINVLMQLRKVCNHPNLFEVRPTISPFQCEGIRYHIPSIVYSALDYDPDKHIDLNSMNLLLIMQEVHFSSYQCYKMRQSRNSKKIIELENPTEKSPPCPPNKLNMRVVPIKPSEVKTEKRPVAPTNVLTLTQPPPLQLKSIASPNMKVKVSGVQLVNNQGVVKTIPLMNISQSASGQIGTPVNVSSVLKPADKISASFAQLVQTSTGKHLLLTSNPNITANIPATTSPGQKLTLLSKQPVSTIGNAGHAIAKALIKFQFSTVTTATTSTAITTTNSNNAVMKNEKDGRLSVGNDYIGKLYSKQNSLDVRWDNEEKIGLPGEEDPKGERRRRLALMNRINERRCSALPLYGRDFQDAVKIFTPNKINSWDGGTINCLNTLFNKNIENNTTCLKNMLYNPEKRIELLKETCDRFIFYVPPVKSSEPDLRVCHPPPSKYWRQMEDKYLIQRLFSKPATPLHHIASAMVTQFPDPRLIQYDCGKLQTLDKLLRRLKVESHRVLIFTQMTKMLDVLEAFLNFHGHIYLRLDGTTKVDQRQLLMEQFNGDTRIFAFILSTRSGGVGVNLTGADTVIFYDSDWNPTMDAQAQDRCHRIGQTRDVHIFRLVSERTIEENILKKANQKRLLGDLAIEGGNFTTAYFKSSTIQDLFNIDNSEESAADRMSEIIEMKREREKVVLEPTPTGGDEKVAIGALENALATCEDDQDVQAAKIAKAEAVADLAEFDENIPLAAEEQEKEPEISKAEMEINSVIEKLSPIERYAMNFIEKTESAWSAEQLAAAAREIEEQKKEWEKNRLAAMKEEEERRARELEEEGDSITFSREDATNQVSLNRKIRKSKNLLKVRMMKKRKKLMRKKKLFDQMKNSPKKLNPRRLQNKLLDTTELESNTNTEESQDSLTVDEVQLNGDTENSMDSSHSESNITLSSVKQEQNHVDHNSPRTRSRGRVAINLWTLDVSPILPGEKPLKRHIKASSVEKDSDDSSERKASKRRLSSISADEDHQSDVEKPPKQLHKRRHKLKNSTFDKSDSVRKTNGENHLMKKHMKVVLTDILADGQFHIGSVSREILQKVVDDNKMSEDTVENKCDTTDLQIDKGISSTIIDTVDPLESSEDLISSSNIDGDTGICDLKSLGNDLDNTLKIDDPDAGVGTDELSSNKGSSEVEGKDVDTPLNSDSETRNSENNEEQNPVSDATISEINSSCVPGDNTVDDKSINDVINEPNRSETQSCSDITTETDTKCHLESDDEITSNAASEGHALCEADDDLGKTEIGTNVLDSADENSATITNHVETNHSSEYTDDNVSHDVDSTTAIQSDNIETPKENVELNDVADDNSSQSEEMKNAIKVKKVITSTFKSPEVRRYNRKPIKTTNNQTLDGWIKRSPKIEQTSNEVGDAKDSVVNDSSESIPPPLNSEQNSDIDGCSSVTSSVNAGIS